MIVIEEKNSESKQGFADRLNEALDNMNAPKRGRAQFLIRLLPFKISVNGVKKWLTGEAFPETDKVQIISDVLKVESVWLLWGEGEKAGLARRLAAKNERPQPPRSDVAMFSIRGDTSKLKIEPHPGTVTHTPSEDSARILGGIETWDSETKLGDDEVALRFLKSVEGAAGIGNHVDEHDHGYRLRFSRRTLSRLGVMPENAICISLSGNSMEPQLPDGSTVGVDVNSRAIVDGKIYAILHGDMVRVKVLYSIPGGGIRLKSFNSAEHPDETYTPEQIREHRIKVLGRVFWSSVLY